MLYRVAVGTGFRAAELAALVPEFFDLDGFPPAIILPPEFTKNRKGAVQPIPADLVGDLRAYLAGRPGREPVWPGTWSVKAADVLRADLAAAGVAVEVDGPEGTETRDFHALRGVYISNVIRAGADLKQAMTLARHSDPRLTAGRYARTRLHDLGAVVNKLPTTETPANQTVLRKTGTDCQSFRDRAGAAAGAATGDGEGGRSRAGGEKTPTPSGEDGGSNPLEMQGFEGYQGRAEADEGEAPAGFEPADNGFANRCLTTWLRGRTRAHGSGESYRSGRTVSTDATVSSAHRTADLSRSASAKICRWHSARAAANPSGVGFPAFR